jgi:predicted PurR-regulated permease PerM
MMSNRVPEPPPNGPPPHGEQVPRGWVHLAALAGLTLVGVYFCYRLAEPFLPALAWALALGIIAHPLHEWLAARIRKRNWSAALAVTLVVLGVVIPGLWVATELAEQATAATTSGRTEQMAMGWRDAAAQVPVLNKLVGQMDQHFNPEHEARQLIASLTQDFAAIVQGSLWGLLQGLVMVFILFFAFRDEGHLLRALRTLLPVSREEADYLFTRTADAIHATVYATIVTGLIQGVTGGLLFWALGLPAPLLWGAVMTILSILPVVGAFVVWVPAAVVLAVDDRFGAALILVIWGVSMTVAANYLYAYLAGGRLRLHLVPTLLSFIGGLVVFGISGMVLGPVILAVTLALIDMWRRRAQPKTGAELPDSALAPT